MYADLLRGSVTFKLLGPRWSLRYGRASRGPGRGDDSPFL